MGLIAHYPLNGNTNDATGNTTPSIVGTPVSSNEGKLGGSYDFNAGRLDVSTANLFLDKDSTICFWVKLDSLPTAGQRRGVMQTIYGAEFAVNITDTGVMQWYYGTSGVAGVPYSAYSVDDMFTVGEWIHVALWTNIATMEKKAYKNGIQLGTTHTMAYVPVKSTAETLNIGYSYVTGNYLPGKLCDVRFYDRSLSIKEIKDLAKAKAIHYKFNTDQQTIENEFLDNWAGLVTDSAQLAAYGGPGTLQIGATDPFGTTDSSVWRKSGNRLRFGETDGTDVGTLYYGETYTFSIYLRHVYDEPQMAAGADFDICDRADLRSYSGSLAENMEFTWKRFWVTAEHDNNVNYHFIDVGQAGTAVFEWCCPQIEKRVRYGKDGLTFYSGQPNLNVSKYTTGRTGVINDDSGNGNDVTLTYENSPYWVGDASNGRKTALFPGENTKKIVLPIDTSIRQDAVTFACWAFQLDTSTQHGTGSIGLQYIVSQGRDTGYQGISIYTSNGLIYAKYGGTSTGVTLGPGGYLTDKWHHLAATYDSSIGGKLYVDGSLKDTNIVVGPLNYTQSSDAFVVGKMAYTNTSTTTYFPFNGYIDDVRVYSTALDASSIVEIMQQKGSIDNTGNFHTGDLQETGHNPLILDYTTWAVGSGSATGFSQNGGTAENERILTTDPWGNDNAIVWEARPDTVSDADGGWNSSDFDIDASYFYRYSIWVWRNSNADGNSYHGLHGYGSTDGVYHRDTGTNETNPYFYTSEAIPTAGRWELIIGHVWPAGSGTGSNHPDSGRYTIKDGFIGTTDYVRDYVWRSETTTANERAYLYYSVDPSIRQQWIYPRVDKLDGTEPSIEDLLGGFDAAHYNYIDQKGGDSYISLDVGFSETNVGKLSEISVSDDLFLWYPLQGEYTPLGRAYEMVKGWDGIIYGDPSILSRGYYFDGTGSETIDTTDIYDTLGDPSTISFSAWVNRTSSVNDYNMWMGQQLPYFSHRSFGNYLFSAKISGTQRVVYSDSSTANIDGIWRHIVGTYDSEDMKIYVDGVLDGTANWPGTFQWNTGEIFAIGDGRSSGTWYPFNGNVSDVRIYEKALTPVEVKILYDTTNPEGTNTVKLTNDTIYLKGELKED